MAQDRGRDRRTLSALAALLPAGTVGFSISLAAAGAKATAVADPDTRQPGAVSERLKTIREDISGAIDEHRSGRFLEVDPEQRLAWWGNGWHNGGWGNGLLPFLFGSPWGNGWHNW